MKKVSPGRKLFLIVAAAVLVVGALALAGCSCSSQQSSSSSSSASEDAMYTVPNVISLTQADAKKAILASGLQVGDIKQEASDTVPLGSVISQSPDPLMSAKANSKVDLVVSTGKAEPKEVAVPDLKGKTQNDAEKALSDAGLVGVASNPEETDEVQPGQVFKQSVAPGATVKEGTKVAFTVAVAPAQTTVPNVVGMAEADARAAFDKAKLGFDYGVAYNDDVEKGKVIAQSVAAGSKVRQGTTIAVTISLGAKPVDNVEVPNVMSFSWSDAEAALRSAGLAARYTGDPAGTVIAQDIAAGTKVAPNTLVTVTLSSPTPKVTV
ncbi:MAG: PASTA domain-containing protein, partial [Eggerthellaceae bacterium]|nr:PASTA domain-containing protein [Eggerthellaceae bacterium]